MYNSFQYYWYERGHGHMGNAIVASWARTLDIHFILARKHSLVYFNRNWPLFRFPPFTLCTTRQLNTASSSEYLKTFLLNHALFNDHIFISLQVKATKRKIGHNRRKVFEKLGSNLLAIIEASSLLGGTKQLKHITKTLFVTVSNFVVNLQSFSTTYKIE